MKLYRCLLLLTAIVTTANSQTNISTNQITSTNSTNFSKIVQQDYRRAILHENNGKTCLISFPSNPKAKFEAVLIGAPDTYFMDMPQGYAQRKAKNDADKIAIDKWGARLDLWESRLPKGEVIIESRAGQEITKYRAEREKYHNAFDSVYAISKHLRAELEESSTKGEYHHARVIVVRHVDRKEGKLTVWQVVR